MLQKLINSIILYRNLLFITIKFQHADCNTYGLHDDLPVYPAKASVIRGAGGPRGAGSPPANQDPGRRAVEGYGGAQQEDPRSNRRFRERRGRDDREDRGGDGRQDQWEANQVGSRTAGTPRDDQPGEVRADGDGGQI